MGQADVPGHRDADAVHAVGLEQLRRIGIEAVIRGPVGAVTQPVKFSGPGDKWEFSAPLGAVNQGGQLFAPFTPVPSVERV